MKSVEWNDRFCIGVEAIDKAHQRLFTIVRRLYQLSQNTSKNQFSCMEGIKYFKNYALKHFAEEEAYMKSIQYEGYEMHKCLHDNMRDLALPVLEMELVRSNCSEEAVRHFLGFCVGWLTQHILIEDHAIVGRASNKWVHVQTEEEISAIKNAVSHAFEDTFRIEARLASNYYGGEDIGKAFYYRLLYRNRENKPQQIYLGFEERLMLRIGNKLSDEPVKKVDKKILDIMWDFTREFAGHIGNKLELLDLNRFEKENLLTYEQLQKDFMKTYPYHSILFDTSDGFFVFCIRN